MRSLKLLVSFTIENEHCVHLHYKIFAHLKQPGLAPSNTEQLLKRFRFKWRHMSACRHSGNPLSTEFMSMPLVYVQACWKYSSSRCLNGFGIWWKRMNSRTLSICVWYLAVPEYNRWMMAETLPNILAYMRAASKYNYFEKLISAADLEYVLTLY